MMPKAAAKSINVTKNPNWLLRGLILLSIAVHALALVHMAGVYNTKSKSYIELEMRTTEKPSARSIPAPPQRQKAERKLKAYAPKPPSFVPVANPTIPPPALQSTEVKPSVVEPISKPLDWQPVGKAKIDGTASSARGSSEDYLGMVRMMIENHKQYPYAARKRRIQGRATVRFVISNDGSATDVILVTPSSHQMLDEAAVAAVKAAGPFPRPPRRLFSGPIPLEICVVFELM
jgi:protein TonB